MKQFSLCLTINPNGRLISELVEMFEKYNSNIFINKHTLERQVNGKSLIGFLSITPCLNDVLDIIIFGESEDNDVLDIQNKLKQMLSNDCIKG